MDPETFIKLLRTIDCFDHLLDYICINTHNKTKYKLANDGNVIYLSLEPNRKTENTLTTLVIGELIKTKVLIPELIRYMKLHDYIQINQRQPFAFFGHIWVCGHCQKIHYSRFIHGCFECYPNLNVIQKREKSDNSSGTIAL